MECCSHSITILDGKLKPHILSNATEQVFTTFFYSNSAQQLQNLAEEILFGHFVATLNDTFK